MNRIMGIHRNIVKKDSALLSYISSFRLLCIRKLELVSLSPVSVFTCFFTVEVRFDLEPVCVCEIPGGQIRSEAGRYHFTNGNYEPKVSLIVRLLVYQF